MPRPVDFLRPAVTSAIRAYPNDQQLPVVEQLVPALESRTWTNSRTTRQKFPEAEAVLNLTATTRLMYLGEDFWRSLMFVVAFTEGKPWFKRFFHWTAKL